MDSRKNNVNVSFKLTELKHLSLSLTESKHRKYPLKNHCSEVSEKISAFKFFGKLQGPHATYTDEDCSCSSPIRTTARTIVIVAKSVSHLQLSKQQKSSQILVYGHFQGTFSVCIFLDGFCCIGVLSES